MNNNVKIFWILLSKNVIFAKKNDYGADSGKFAEDKITIA